MPSGWAGWSSVADHHRGDMRNVFFAHILLLSIGARVFGAAGVPPPLIRSKRNAAPFFIMTVPGRSFARPASPWRPRLPPSSVRAIRKPLLLFRLSVVFLLRFAARRFLGLLFHEPPRNTRRGDGQAPGRNGSAPPERWPGASAMYRHVRRARSNCARVE